MLTQGNPTILKSDFLDIIFLYANVNCWIKYFGTDYTTVTGKTGFCGLVPVCI